MRICKKCNTKPTLTPKDWYCPECKAIAKEVAKVKNMLRNRARREAQKDKEKQKQAKKENMKKLKKLAKHFSPASQRWIMMPWVELTKELDYYGITYPQSQVMKENNTLPEDFGLKRKKVNKCGGR